MTDTMTAPDWQLLAAESALQDTIRVAALRNGWHFYHTRNSRRSDAGFPDCVCIKDGRMLVFELKAQKGKVTPQQRRWIEAFDALPMVIAAIVRPEPKEDGEMPFDDALGMLGEAAFAGGRGEAGE